MLEACPKCQRTFPQEDGSFCPDDGTRLLPIDEVSVPPNPKDPLVGRAVDDRYEIRRIVADGGMGRVYEARDLTAQRRVALKILHPEIAEEEVNIERFRREAVTSRDLSHEHVVDVIDFAKSEKVPGRSGAAWYLVMEYLDGEELRAVIDREGTLPLSRVLRVVSQLAKALDAAHEKGFVHRDLKPDNVFLVRQPDGDVVKLLDFGSVKFTKGQDRSNKLTVLGTTIGSPYYMSPEQAQGLPDLDGRADVWAVGVMVYEMLVGKLPFTGPNGPQILFKILSDEPSPPSFANEKAPPELDDLMLKALQKKPADRYQTVREFAVALGRAFRLEGDPESWVAISEAELSERLNQAAGRRVSFRPEAEKADAPSAEPATSDDAKREATKSDAARREPATREPSTSDAAKREPAKPAAPRSAGDGDEPLVVPQTAVPVALYVGVAVGVIVVVLLFVLLR